MLVLGRLCRPRWPLNAVKFLLAKVSMASRYEKNVKRTDTLTHGQYWVSGVRWEKGADSPAGIKFGRFSASLESGTMASHTLSVIISLR